MARDDWQQAKHAGQHAAKRWCSRALPNAQVTLAGWRFEYGMTLNYLISQGADVPPSEDKNYSWGFFKQVKGRIHDALRSSTTAAKDKAAAAARTHIFVSYSHRDRQWLERLQTHLKPLIRAEFIDLWDDARIYPSFEWQSEVDKALSLAQIAILIVSADFLASDFICRSELPPILTKAAGGGVRILSLIVRPCLYAQHTALSRYQAVNDPRYPLSSLPEHEVETILVRLSEQIYESVGASPLGLLPSN